MEIEKIGTEHKKLIDLEKRKETIFERLAQLKVHDTSLLERIKGCYDSKQLEDYYLPYKPKRKTKATNARALGLEPLAKIIMAQRSNGLSRQVGRFTKNGLTVEDALQGARDIIAEWISEHAYARNQLRRIYRNTAVLVAAVDKKKKDEAIKYRDYFDFSQPVKRIPSHRLLAILRAENEGYLKVKIEIDKDEAIRKLGSYLCQIQG